MLAIDDIKVMSAAILGAFLYALDGTIMNIALPNIMAVFNQTPDHAQLVLSAYTLAAAIAMAASAFLMDRIGIKKCYLISMGLFLIGSILCGLAWNGDVLILFRVIQGLSGGVLLPCAMAMLVIFIPPEKRAVAMSAVAIPSLVAPALGPVIGGYLVTYWNWRYCFYINIPIILMGMAVGYLWLRETPSIVKRFDFRGFILVSIGLCCILYALSYAPTWHWDERVVILLTVGVITLVIWVIVALRTESPLLELRLFKMGGFSLSVALFAAVIAAMYVLIFLLPMFLQNLRGLTALSAGLLLFSNAFGTIVAMPVVSKVYEMWGVRRTVILGLVVMTVTGLWLQSMDTTTPDLLFQGVMFIRGFGTGFALIPAMSYALSAAPPHLSTQGSSMVNVVQCVGIAISIALFATLLDNFQKTDLAIIVQSATPDSPQLVGMIARIQVSLMQAGQTMEAAYRAAVYLLYQYFNLRSAITAFEKNFVLDALISLVSIVPALFLPRGAGTKSEGGAAIVI